MAGVVLAFELDLLFQEGGVVLRLGDAFGGDLEVGEHFARRLVAACGIEFERLGDDARQRQRDAGGDVEQRLDVHETRFA